MGVGETGQIIGETGVGETGVGEMGVIRWLVACMTDLTLDFHISLSLGSIVVEIPLRTVSLCQCLPRHLGLPWPTLPIYLYVADCNTGAFNMF